jgi:predicted oxidoreductase
MKTMALPGTDLVGSKIIMGNFRIEFLPELAEREAYIKAALDEGINFFDHSDVYGTSNPLGKSDELFAQVLDLKSSIRDQLIIQSKVGSVYMHTADGRRVGIHDLSKEHILESVEGSLRRLNTDYLDILVMHRTDPLMRPEEIAAAFDELHASGKVRYFGVSNSTPMRMELLRKHLNQPLVVDQLHLSLVDTALIDYTARVPPYSGPTETFDSGAGVLDYCRIHDIQIQSWSPLTYFSPVQRQRNPNSFHPYVPFVDDDRQFGPLNEALARIGDRYGIPKLGVVVAWFLTHPARIQPVIGTSSPTRIRDLASGSGVTLTREEWYELYFAAGNTAII